MALTKKRTQFWRDEMSTLDTLYKKRAEGWKLLIDLYNNDFNKKIRDLSEKEVVKVPLFFQITHQLIATVAFNYPTLLFTVEDDVGEGTPVADVLERASQSWLRLSDAKSHLHQAIFDALFCGVGWLRMDYNPPGDDMIPPYVANDEMAEDLASVCRVPPSFVHLDPQCPPHSLGQARYIRERMWVPLEQLKKDEQIEHKSEIKASTADQTDELAYGEMMSGAESGPEEAARKESIDNGNFVLIDRIHDRMNKRELMFADGVDEPIKDIHHPFAKMSFPMRMGATGEPILDDEGQPLFDLESGDPQPGWLVRHGFPFVPIKFDISSTSFYPTPRMEHLKDLVYAYVESMSRISANLKRSARMGVVKESEAENNPDLIPTLQRGNDGEYTTAIDPRSAIHEINFGAIPPDQWSYADRAKNMLDLTSNVAELLQTGGESARTATESGLLAAAAAILREWMEAKVGRAFEDMVRNAFNIMGDPRYEPEFFLQNVAPDGEERLTRALRNADFLWNYRIHVQAGSTRPLAERLEKSKTVELYNTIIQHPSVNQTEALKMLLAAYEKVDSEKLLNDQGIDEDTQQLVQLENNMIETQFTDPGVTPGMDHMQHNENHNARLQELMQQPSIDPNMQFIIQVYQQHIATHDQHSQSGTVPQQGKPSDANPVEGVRNTVNQTAQKISLAARDEAQETLEG